jgi:hypothetical protein
MNDGFLSRYLRAFDGVPWFSPDAGLLLLAYHQLLAEDGLSGDTLEIGVHEGLSAIAIAAMRGDGRRFVAIDRSPQLPSGEVAPPWFGSFPRMLANMRRFFDHLSFVTTIDTPSTMVQPDDIGRSFVVCHIDGGHLLSEAYADLELATGISLPGGLIAVDDYFNPAFPGVGEAAVRFSLQHDGALRPIAIGFNMAVFQREPAPFDLNARFAERFPQVFAGSASLWGVRVPVYDAAFRAAFDWQRSRPRRLVAAADALVREPASRQRRTRS